MDATTQDWSPGWSPAAELLQLDAHGVPALFREVQGGWRGTYYKIAASGEKLRQFEGLFVIRIEADHYHQTNHYRFPDGATLDLEFHGRFGPEGVLAMASPSRQDFRAMAWQAGPRLILFESRKREAGHRIHYLETIQIDSATTRARTTLEYRDGAFSGVNFIRETRA
jgi:hypothetical protein